MTDSYLSISDIAANASMARRMTACVTQQDHLGSISPVEHPAAWVGENSYLWASSPSWGEKWAYAEETHSDNPTYDPGADAAVITDADILATVQALLPLPQSQTPPDEGPPVIDNTLPGDLPPNGGS